MTAADMNANIDQDRNEFDFITTNFLAPLKRCASVSQHPEQQRCHRGFPLYPPCFLGVRENENRRIVLKLKSRVSSRQRNLSVGAQCFRRQTHRVPLKSARRQKEWEELFFAEIPAKPRLAVEHGGNRRMAFATGNVAFGLHPVRPRFPGRGTGRLDLQGLPRH